MMPMAVAIYLGTEASTSGVGEAERYFKEHLHSAEATQVPVLFLYQTQPFY